MKKILIQSLQETKLLASRIAPRLPSKACICLSGDLGAGKTTFTKALGKSLGIEAMITSPTFTILKSYEGKVDLHHMDAYRLEGAQEELGLEELFDQDGVVVVEWYNYIKDQLPKERLEINILLDQDTRTFEVCGVGEEYIELENSL